MLAFGLSVLTFLLWALIGRGPMRLLNAGRSGARELLLAPAVGVAITVIPVFILNRLGLPVGRFGRILTVGLMLGGLLLAWRQRRDTSPNSRFWYVPFAVVILLGMLLTGRPMFEFGFAWVSYCNDDMANYSMAADRVLRCGFFDAPTAAQLVDGIDWCQQLWFLQVPRMTRPGSDLLLAWQASWTGLGVHKAFMPLTIALQGVLVSAAAGLAIEALPVGKPAEGEQAGRSYGPMRSALLTTSLVAASPLVAYGCVEQLIGQVLGVSLLVAAAALLLRPFTGACRTTLARHGALLGIVGSGLVICYPELTPFLGASLAVYAAACFAVSRVIRMARARLGRPSQAPSDFEPAREPRAGWRGATPHVLALGAAALVALVLLNGYAFTTILFLVTQSRYVMGDAPDATHFPFYLTPAGPAHFWGLIPLSITFEGPHMERAVIAGGVLLLLAAAAAFWAALRRRPEGAMSVVMLALAAAFFHARSGFALYKLAMYAQPFLLAAIVAAWGAVSAKFRRPPLLACFIHATPIVVLMVFMWPARRAYVEWSRGDTTRFNEVPGASRSRILEEMQSKLGPYVAAAKASSGAADAPYLLADEHNLIVSKFMTLYTQGASLAFPSNKLWQSAIPPKPQPETPVRSLRELSHTLTRTLLSRLVPRTFELEPSRPGEKPDLFLANEIGRPPPGSPRPGVLIAGTSRLTPFNRREPESAGPGNFNVVPFAQAQNHLLFTNSNLGEDYYQLVDRRFGAIYQIEADPVFFRGQTFAGVGRDLLFEVINPTPGARLALTMTCSLRGDGDNRLPPAVAIGSSRPRSTFAGAVGAHLLAAAGAADDRRPPVCGDRYGARRRRLPGRAAGDHAALRQGRLGRSPPAGRFRPRYLDGLSRRLWQARPARPAGGVWWRDEPAGAPRCRIQRHVRGWLGVGGIVFPPDAADGVVAGERHGDGAADRRE